MTKQMMKQRETEIQAAWKQIEFFGDHWKNILHTEFPLIPIHILKPFFSDQIVQASITTVENNQKQLIKENEMLKLEIYMLKLQLEDSENRDPSPYTFTPAANTIDSSRS